MTGIGHGYVTQEHILWYELSQWQLSITNDPARPVCCVIMTKNDHPGISFKRALEISSPVKIICKRVVGTRLSASATYWPTRTTMAYQQRRVVSTHCHLIPTRQLIKKSRIYPFKDRPASRFGIAAVKWSVGGSVGSGGWCRFPLLECFPRRRWATWRAPPSPTRTVQRAVNFSSAASLFSPRISSA